MGSLFQRLPSRNRKKRPMNYKSKLIKNYRGIIRFPAMAGTFFSLATIPLASLAETVKPETNVCSHGQSVSLNDPQSEGPGKLR